MNAKKRSVQKHCVNRFKRIGPFIYAFKYVYDQFTDHKFQVIIATLTSFRRRGIRAEN